MKTKFKILIFLITFIFPGILFSQLRPYFKYNNLDIGIHGLDESEFMTHSPDGETIAVSSLENSCVSILKFNIENNEWYHFQSLFMEDYGVSAHIYFALAYNATGEHLYAVCTEDEQTICTFTADPSSDSLYLTSQTSDIPTNIYSHIINIKVSPNGKFIFAITWSNILKFSRNQSNGELTFISNTELENYTQFDILISSDNKNLYLAPINSVVHNYIQTYQIDEVTANLNLIETIEFTYENNFLGLYDASSFDIDPEGEFIYVASNELSVFSRDASDGTLTFIANQDNLGKPDIVNNKIRNITKVYVDKINNQQVHLYSLRDGWILMDKSPELDTLSFKLIIEEEIIEWFAEEKNIISIGNSLFITSNYTNTLKNYIYFPDQDTTIFNHYLDANENSLENNKLFFLSPDETRLFTLSYSALSMFNRDLENGSLDLVGSVDFPKVSEERHFCQNPQGNNIYIASNHLCVYKVNEGDELPELIQLLDYNLRYAMVIASNDGKYLYAASDHYEQYLTSFSIDDEGLISEIDNFQIEDKIYYFCQSDDGRFLYTASQTGHNIKVYSRNLTTGLLTEIQTIQGSNFENTQIPYVTILRISNDGKFMYTGSSERTPGLLKINQETGLLSMIGDAGNYLPSSTKKVHTLTLSNDDRYLYLTHTWWDPALFVFERNIETGIINETKFYYDDDPELEYINSRYLINDKDDRFMYALGWNFLACFKIDPILEDTLTANPGESVEVYANPYYEEYNWSVSTSNQNSIVTDQKGWVHLGLIDNYGIYRYDSVYIEESNSINNSSEKTFAVTIFPNPAKEILNLSNNLDDNELVIKIYSQDGQLKTDKIFENEYGNISLDISNLSVGIYFIQIYNNKKFELLGKTKFIKL